MPLRAWIGTPIVAAHLLVLPPSPLSAQLAVAAEGGSGGADPGAATYDLLFDELMRMRRSRRR